MDKEDEDWVLDSISYNNILDRFYNIIIISTIKIMENNLENKAKFFAQYYGQEVLKWHDRSIVLEIICSDLKNLKINHSLELKPLSSITDEDAIEVATMTYAANLNTADWGRHSLFNDIPKGKYKLSLEVSDYLRSKGYYLGDGKEIEYGWIELAR